MQNAQLRLKNIIFCSTNFIAILKILRIVLSATIVTLTTLVQNSKNMQNAAFATLCQKWEQSNDD